MNNSNSLALAGIALSIAFATASAAAQDRCDAVPACHEARELRDRMNGITECNAENSVEVLDLVHRSGTALASCEERSVACADTLRDSIIVLDQALARCGGRAGSIVSDSPDRVCQQLCEANGHGTWTAADADHERAYCAPADGYRIVDRCMPRVRPRPRDRDRPRTPPPVHPAGTRCNTGIDTDADGWSDLSGDCIPVDNCRTMPNPDQGDRDNDGEGDECDDEDDLEHWRELLREHCADDPSSRLCRDAPAIVGTPGDPPAAALPEIEDDLLGFCTADGDHTRLDRDLEHHAHPVCRELWRLASEVTRLTAEDRELHAMDTQILARDDCQDRGRRTGGLATDLEVDELGAVAASDRVVCLEECLIDGAVYNAESQRCELPESDAGSGHGVSVTVDAVYWHYIADVIGLESSAGIPLSDDARLRLRAFIALGVSPQNGDHDTAGAALGGAGLEYAIVDEDMIRVTLGLGAFGTGSVELTSGLNPFGGGGGYGELRIEAGPRRGPRFFIGGRFLGGYCDASWGQPSGCLGGSAEIGVTFDP